jgi:RND family efflux transporter MFP subunit
MKKIAICLTAFVVVGLLSCKDKEKSSDQSAKPDIDVAAPIVKNITLTKEYPGYISSDKTVKLVARVSGMLQKSYLQAGKKVKKGDLIFVIEPTQYQDAVSQAEASLKTANAQLVYAKSNYERMKEAVKSGAVSKIQVIQAEATANEMEASVKNAEAALNTAKTNLGYCYVRAPFDGRITLQNVDVGNYVNGTAEPVTLATLYKDDIVYVNFNIEDNQYMLMKLQSEKDKDKSDQPKTIDIQVGETNPLTYTANLSYLSPNVNLSTGTLTLQATLPNEDGELKSGLYVSITLPYAEVKDAILVNDASIGTDQAGKYLYVVNDSNTVEYRHIETGQVVDDTLRQVISGLSPDELYVTKALLKVRQGMRINPIK